MSKFEVIGGRRLKGELVPQGAKNEALQVICACLLTREEVVISNIPEILDVIKLIDLLRGMGVKVERLQKGEFSFRANEINFDYLETEDFYSKAASLRGSIMILGPLLAMHGCGLVPKPGGDKIGRRRLDTHFLGFEKLGATFEYDAISGCYKASAQKLRGTYMLLDEASVTGTANIIMAAVLAEGVTTIYNAACEPYVQQLCRMLNAMGARISGIASNLLTIEGVESLHGTHHQVIPDRIEAGTYIAMAAAIGEGVRITNVLYEHLESYIVKLEEMGVRMTVEEDAIFVEKQSTLKAVSVKTSPYPGFATDLQQPITPLLLIAEGRGTILDTIYEKRTNHIAELVRMGADISIVGGRIAYQGPNKLTGAPVKASDLRAGAALVTAGLMADGQTEITNVEFILRGYSNIIEKLTALGADIKLIEE